MFKNTVKLVKESTSQKSNSKDWLSSVTDSNSDSDCQDMKVSKLKHRYYKKL